MISHAKDWIWNVQVAASGFNDTDLTISLATGERAKLQDPASVGSYRMTCYNRAVAASHLDPYKERITVTAFSGVGDDIIITRNANGQGTFNHNTVDAVYYLELAFGEELVSEINADIALKANITSPTFIAPVLGDATCSHINGLHITTTTGTITLTNAKTLSVSNTLTLTATDGVTLAIGGGGTLGTAAYTDATAYTAAGAIATHAALITGVHGLAITSGKILTVQDNVTITGALGTGAYATIANYALVGQTMFIGTTSVAINRTTGALVLTGITSIDGNAATHTVADETSDTTCFPLFATAQSGSLPGKTNANLTYNASTGELRATIISTITGFTPDANDGAYLGTTALQFSDLFLAEGGVINWDNGDATLTQVGDMVTLAGANFTVDSIIINTGIVPDATDGAYLGTTTLSFSDLFLAQGAVINFSNGNVTLTHSPGILAISGQLNSTLTSAPTLVCDAYNDGDVYGRAVNLMQSSYTSNSIYEKYVLKIVNKPILGDGTTLASSYALGIYSSKDNWATTVIPGQVHGIMVTIRGGSQASPFIAGGGDAAALVFNVEQSSDHFSCALEGVTYYAPGGVFSGEYRGVNVQIASVDHKNGIYNGFYTSSIYGILTDAFRVSTGVGSSWSYYFRATNAASATMASIDSTGNMILAGTLTTSGLLGTPTAPTAAANTNTTQIATTAFAVAQDKLARHLRFTIVDPFNVYAKDSHISLIPNLDAAITITGFVVTLDSTSATQIAGDIACADSFITLANPAVLHAFDTTAGYFSSGAETLNVAAGKYLYLVFDAQPIAAITQISFDITYKYQ
jgi:hypothetical protein